MTTYRDYTYLGLTQSLCPECLQLLPAKVIQQQGRIYFQKHCPTHGRRTDFVCSDARWFDRTEYSLPGKVPLAFGTEPQSGCPYDCGLCSEHEQHTCLGLLEITSSCNLDCPMCFAESGPGGNHLSVADCRRAIDRFVEVEGQPEILQLSGGEPTIHPEFAQILDYACAQPIDIVMINTNGVRLARDPRFLDLLVKYRKRIEIYLQCDGLQEHCYAALRGESLLDVKRRAVERLGEAQINTILVSTVASGVNEDQYGALVNYGLQRPWITGVSFQPATYSGRYFLPEDLEQRVTFPDILHGLEQQTAGQWKAADFAPLPCAHPNGHTLAYAIRSPTEVIPLARFMELTQHLDLLSGRITFNRQRAQELISTYLTRQPCAAGGCETGAHPTTQAEQGRAPQLSAAQLAAVETFFQRALQQDLDPQHMFRITTTSFMDAYNFDVRQLMKSCVHFLLPSGHIIPFSAYNVLYRNGHIPLPPLRSLSLANLP